jgi:hypothetical protein
MSRFNELRRIEDAIKNKDKDQLLWGIDYCKSRIKTANQMGLSAKAAKQHTKHWKKILDEIEETLSGINSPD